MYLQGQLQVVFDALYHMGVIDPVLKMDWTEVLQERQEDHETFERVLNVANGYQQDLTQLMEELDKFDHKVLGFLAMEVAKEFADYHARKDIQ
jgi:hypothetical protein